MVPLDKYLMPWSSTSWLLLMKSGLMASRKTTCYFNRLLFSGTWCLFATLVFLGTAVAGDEVDFVRDVRPILQAHCYKCHSGEKDKSGFRLDIKQEALQGGDLYGTAIAPGKPSDSPLVQLLKEPEPAERMPLDAPPLADQEILIIEKWVSQGAKWPDGIDLVEAVDKADHWSLKKVNPQSLPAVQNTAWPKSGVDYFVLSSLERAGLSPTPAASRERWLRRVTLDLIGLPPTPEEYADFANDLNDDAYERVVDRLLASPRYGERWGQHWLDVVRYADTHGFEVNTERPNAWPYRDYVIRALNNDTAYDQFVYQQIAGEQVGEDAATGFLVTASVLLPGQIGQDEPSKRLARQDALDEIVVNIGQSFLGLSVGCARCHDHKFDAISQKDYYAMQAFVAGVEYEDRELLTPEAKQARQLAEKAKEKLIEIDRQLSRIGPLALSGKKRPTVHAKYNTDRIAPFETKKVRFTILKTNNLEPCIDEFEVFNASGENVALATNGARVESSGDNVAVDRHELRFVNDGVYGNSRSWMSSEMGRGWLVVEFAKKETIDCLVWGRDREQTYKDRLAIEYKIEVEADSGEWILVADHTDRSTYHPDARMEDLINVAELDSAMKSQVDALHQQRGILQQDVNRNMQGQLAFAGKFRKADLIRILTRGDPEQPKDKVSPAVISALGNMQLEEEASEAERRHTLATWIIDRSNPLTARVMVNRIWQSHFGIGLVETANDFGRNGTLSSHPELLDWLAGEFVSSDWSMKHLHRQIVLSATYGQDSTWNPKAGEVDADTRLLWRFSPRRMDAEMIRDSILSMSGQLHHSMGGRGFDLFEQRGGLSGFKPIEKFSGDGLRRMIYAHKVRRERDAVFGAFDCPDAGQSTARRRESTTPLQALNLLNSRFTVEQADGIADSVMRLVGTDPSRQIDYLFRMVLGRSAEPEEMAEIRAIVQAEGLSVLCRALINSNEFVMLP